MQNLSSNNEFYCIRITIYFVINALALSLASKQRITATRKWSIHKWMGITWPLVNISTKFLQRLSMISKTAETTTPPSKIINTPAKLFRSRRCVLPVLDCEGFGHLLRSSHQVRRVFSMKFFSRNYMTKIERFGMFTLPALHNNGRQL